MTDRGPTLTIAWSAPELTDALQNAGARRDLERQLPDYLRVQRWFGGAARRLVEARIERWVPLFKTGEPVRGCLCVIAALDEDGVTTEHQLILALGERQERAGGDRRVVLDGLHDEYCRALLFELVLGGDTRSGMGADLICEATGQPVAELGGAGGYGSGRLLGAEQSNTSILFDAGPGKRYLLKLYRRIERGPNPEVELGRFLTAEAGFTAIPALVATARLEGPDGFVADTLTVQEFVPNEGDGWTWALDRARAALAATRAPDALLPWLTRERETLAGAAALGQTTAQLHIALASATDEELHPRPVTAEDAQRWLIGLRDGANATAAALRQADQPDAATLAAIERVSELPVPDLRNAGLKTRVHGDYHLGQVLKTAAGFVILDFEGEPARTLAERRSHQHPLLDVAGMMRSWSYAAATVARDAAPAHDTTGADGMEVDKIERRAACAARWEALVKDRFLAAYWSEADRAPRPFLPGDSAQRAALLRLFELHKALYEVRYELNYRPTWVAIPAVAVRALVDEAVAGTTSAEH